MSDKMVNIVTRPSMFRETLYYTQVPDGITLADVVGPNVCDDVVIFVNDRRIELDHWATTHIFHEDIISIAILPAGGGDGGKNPLRTIAMIAVMVVATIAAPYMLPAGLKGASIIGGLTWKGVATGMLMTGGMMAVNALIPPPTPSAATAGAIPNIGTPAAAFSITGGQNQARPYGVIQKLFGSTRFFPDRAANPYTEIRGNDQYFYMLLSAGYANIDVSALKIGDTAIADYEDTRFEVGYIDEITLFKRNAVENSESVKIGLGQSVTRGLADGETTHDISVDICFAQGLRSVNQEGADGWAQVQITVEFSEAGAGVWQAGHTQTFNRTAKDPVRDKISFQATTVAEGIDIRVSNTLVSYQFSQYTFSDCYVTAVRSLKSGPAVIDPDRKFMFIAIEIRATDQLNGIVDNVSCLGESYLPVYNGTNWIYQKSNNPAWAYVEACHGEQLAHSVPYSKINAAAIKDWADWCTAQGATYNNVHDTEATMLEHLHNIAAAGRASHSITEGLFSVVRDTLQIVPVQMISPRNSSNFKAKKVFPDPPHALKVKYIDPEGLAEVTRIVYADGYDETTATKFEELPTIGCQDPDWAWKYGRYYLADMLLRPEEYSATMGWGNLRCKRGSMVNLAHDVMQVGITWGRVKEVIGPTTVKLDEMVPFEAGKSYVIRFHKSDGVQELITVTGNEGFNTTVTLAAVVEGLAAGDHFIFGEAGKESMDAKIKGISYNPDLSADLVLVPAAPEILDADQGPIPAFDPIMTGPVNPRFVSPAIPELVFFEAFESVSGSSVAAQLVVGFHVPNSTPIAQKVQIKYQHDGNWQTAGADAVDGVIPLSDVPAEGTVIEFKIRARSDHNVWSQWSASKNYTVSYSQVIMPQTVTGFAAAAVTDGIRLSWNNLTALQITKYKVRVGTSFETGATVFDGLADAVTDPNKTAGTRTYWIVSVNSKRVSNPTSVGITINPPAAPVVTKEISEGLAMLDWDDCRTTFPIRHYIVTSGIDVHYISNTQYTEKITWTGSKDITIQAEDTGGNLSTVATVPVSTPAVTAVTGLTAAGGVHSIVIRVDYSATDPEEIEEVEIHGGTTNDRSVSGLVARLKPGKHSHVQPGIPLLENWYYWARIRNRAKIYSDWFPASATAGVQGAASDDPADYVQMFDAMISDGDLLSQFSWTSLKDFFEWEGTGRFTISDGNEAIGLANAVVNGLAAIEQRMIALDTSRAEEYIDTEPYPIGKIVTWQGKYYRKIKPSAAGISPSNTTFWTSMTAGILNQWVMKMNANGHVAGIGMTLDDSGDSEFIIQANKFAVVTDNPAAPGTPLSMFQVGLVNGVTMVGMRGDLMLDGTVGAKAMKTDELFIGLSIQSLDFISGTTGWNIPNDGPPEFNGGIFRGSVHIAPGSSGYNNIDDTPDTSAAWSGTEVPTLANAPAVDWDTYEKREAHLNDLYSKAGSQIYQFVREDNVPPAVALSNVQNTTVGADSIGSTGIGASAVSTTSYTGGVLLEFKIGNISGDIVCGISQNPTAGVNWDMDFGWYLYPPSVIKIREGGSFVHQAESETITTDTLFSIYYDGTSVRYYKDRALVYESQGTIPANATFFIDSWLTFSGNGINSIKFGPDFFYSYQWIVAATEDSDIRSTNDLVDASKVDPATVLTIGDLVNGPYARMDTSGLTFYQKFGGILRAVKALKQVDGGVMDSGVWHTIDGYWANPPGVGVFPAESLTYHYSYAAQSQKMRNILTDIELVSEGVYRIKGESFLESQAGSTLVYPNLSCSGSSSANTASYTCPSNTRKITANLRFLGYCGVWFDGDYNRCQIQIRAKLVYYTNGAWVDSSWSPIYTVGQSYIPTTVSTPTTSTDIVYAYLYIEKTANTASIISLHNGADGVAGVLDSMTCSLAGGAVITTGKLGYVPIGE